jgi:hypothetical protein
VLGRWRLRALLRAAAAVDDPAWLGALRESARRLAIRRPVALLCSDATDVPLTAGVLSPVLVLPAAAEDWSPARRRAALDHELAHVGRLDALTQWIGDLAAVVYWFHPLVWRAAAEMRAQRERACDDHVLKCGALASEYARDLLDIACGVAPDSRHAAALAMARRSQLEARLVAVLDPAIDRSSVSSRALALVALAAAAALVPLATVGLGCASRPAAAAPAHSPAPIAAAPSSPAPDEQASPPASATRVANRGDDHGVSSPPCAAGEKTHRNISVEQEGGRRTIMWSAGDCTVEVRSQGTIAFRPDMSDVSSISPGGYIEIAEREGGQERRLRVAPGPTAQLRYELEVDRRVQPMDGAARRWLAGLLLALERATGFNADQRVRHLLAHGGPGAVLAEVPSLRSDYVRSGYLRRLVEVGRLDEAAVERAVELAGRRIDSDYELAQVLMAVGARYPLASAGSRAAFLRAAATLESDYERARVLIEILERPNLNRDAARMALASAAGLGSDYERARVLIAISNAHLVDAGTQPAYMTAVTGIKSDYERARVLIDLMERQKLAPGAARLALKAAAGMSSDYERSRVLVTMIEKRGLPADQRALYFDAVRGMHSDYERARSLVAVLDGSKLDGDAALKLLGAASAMKSDYEKASVLVALAAKVKLTGDALAAYRRIARQIGSGYERDRSLAALAGD